MKNVVLAVVILVSAARESRATDYYVSNSGLDTNNGLSPTTAWKTLSRVNNKSPAFAPGDRILFASGSSWIGQLRPPGKGSSSAPIVIDKFGTGALPKINGGGLTNMVGVGAETNCTNTLDDDGDGYVNDGCAALGTAEGPGTYSYGGKCNDLIDSDSDGRVNDGCIAVASQGAVFLLNTSYVQVRNLEVMNCSDLSGPLCLGTPPESDSGRARLVGIQVLNTSGALRSGIYIGGNTVHHVSGYMSGLPADQDAITSKNGGISVSADFYSNSRYHDVLVENNTIYDVDNTGIYVGFADQLTSLDSIFARANPTTGVPNTAVIIRNNTVMRAGGNAILNTMTSNALIEGNVVSVSGLRGKCSAAVFTVAAYGTTHQYNEVYDTTVSPIWAGCDRSAFDIDWGSISHTIQYNYSHGNIGGFVMFYETHDASAGSPSQNTYLDNAMVRFNVSVNDGSPSQGTFNFCGSPVQFPFGMNPTDIANNTIIVDGGIARPIISHCLGGNTLQVVGRSASPGDNCGGYPCGLYFYNNIVYSWRWQAGDMLSWTDYMLGSIFDFNTYYGSFSDLPRGHGLYDVYRNAYLVNPLGPEMERGAGCTNSVDNDGDGRVNDGCIASGSAEAGAQCTNALDDDGDGLVNDGCVAFGPYPTLGRNSVWGTKLLAHPNQYEVGSGYQSGYLGVFDYWGNAVSTSTAPNRGAYNGTAVP